MNTTTTNPIAVAVSPLKEDAMARAEEYAREIVEKVREELAAAGSDINTAAPYPNAMRCSRNEYLRAQAKRTLFHKLTHTRPGYFNSMTKGPHIVDVTDANVAHFIKETREEAAAQYEAFVAKLSAKIGAVETATLSGRGVWAHSILSVTKSDGSRENWKTQMILNVSSLGKVFNQWPTRKMK